MNYSLVVVNGICHSSYNGRKLPIKEYKAAVFIPNKCWMGYSRPAIDQLRSLYENPEGGFNPMKVKDTQTFAFWSFRLQHRPNQAQSRGKSQKPGLRLGLARNSHQSIVYPARRTKTSTTCSFGVIFKSYIVLTLESPAKMKFDAS